MDERMKEILDKCEELIDNATPEDLEKYEESLNINYDDYIAKEDYVIKNDFGGRVVVDWCGNELNNKG